MTNQEFENWKGIIDSMSHVQMVMRLRSKVIHPIFQNEVLCKYFMNRINNLGGVNYTKEEDDLISRRVDQFVKTGTYN